MSLSAVAITDNRWPGKVCIVHLDVFLSACLMEQQQSIELSFTKHQLAIASSGGDQEPSEALGQKLHFPYEERSGMPCILITLFKLISAWLN